MPHAYLEKLTGKIYGTVDRIGKNSGCLHLYLHSCMDLNIQTSVPLFRNFVEKGKER